MKIADIRRARGLTQVQLAERLGVDQPTVSRLERGTGGTTLRNLQAAATVLGCSISDFFDDDRTESERTLIGIFRDMPVARQRGWLDMARLASQKDLEED